MAREGGAGAGGEDSEVECLGKAGERAELDGEQIYLFLPIPSDLLGLLELEMLLLMMYV